MDVYARFKEQRKVMVMSIGNISSLFSSNGTLKPISKAKWQSVLQKALQDGGQVDDVKMYSDQTGQSGENDYFSALGYDA
jgi:hypothetical protein